MHGAQKQVMDKSYTCLVYFGLSSGTIFKAAEFRLIMYYPYESNFD